MKEKHWRVVFQFEGGNAAFPARGLTKEIAIARATLRLVHALPKVKIIDVSAAEQDKKWILEVKKHD